MSHSGYVHVDVERITGETDRAFFAVIDGEEICLTKSQVADPDDYEPGDEGVSMAIMAWLAKQRGIE